MSLHFKNKFVRSVYVISTILFLNQNLLCEDIIDSKKQSSSIIEQVKINDNSIIAEYNIKKRGTITISNNFIDFTSNNYFKYGFEQNDSIYITYKKGNKFLNHKVFEMDIKGEKYISVFLLFNDGNFGFYLFNKEMRDLEFFQLKKFEKIDGKKISFDVEQKSNLISIPVFIENVIDKTYKVDLKNFKSKRLNIE